MKTINALIVDDEPLAREIIQSHLAKISNWIVVASCANAEEAYEALLKFEVEVLFLDIQMPVITGIDFLKSLKHPPLVIFTTAYNEYALKGYELNIVDYLLKPIIFNRFYQAIEKAQERLTHSKKTEELEFNNTYFFFKYNGKLLKIVFADILYAKAEQEYSYIYTKDDKFLVSIHLKKLQEILPHEEFLRIHRSYIVAKSKIISIAGNSVQVLESITLPIAKNKKSELLNSLNIRNSTK